MIVDDPAVTAEVREAFLRYEAALMANDLETLDRLFWPDERTIRIGPGQNLYGIEAIRAFRQGRVGGSPQRTLSNTRIVGFGRDFAVAHTEFQREGESRPGRQTQTWARFPDGWRVVAAHVSLMESGD